MIEKPNQTIPLAKLQPIPAIDDSLSRIIVDNVERLSKTRSSKHFPVTTMGAVTRLLEANLRVRQSPLW